MTNPGADPSQVKVWAVAGRYLGIILGSNLIWEFAHMPLYEIWYEGTPNEIIYAGLHCTAGDVLIAGFALMISLLVFGHGRLSSRETFMRAAILTIILGISYTIFSEYLNITIRKSWAYSDLMPVIPVIDTGLSPLLQWLILPVVAFRIIGRLIRRI